MSVQFVHWVDPWIHAQFKFKTGVGGGGGDWVIVLNALSSVGLIQRTIHPAIGLYIISAQF